ncbi:LEA type 2 family protein [Aurantibacillus circumpalustris]|uniref:LEA type 2 family protein n=1 Tax=Aurantibacillus circumpalustris TaxID=3036359 RepID=UPI00295C38DF|nr:LEA type 2 family protein [Aurantibacillus circumpalustris]
MFSRFHLLTLLAVSLLLFTNCRDYKEIQTTGVKGFKVNKISTEGIDGDIMIGIKNPNNFGFSIYKSAFDVNYSGVYLGKAKLTKRVHISANEEEVYSFNLKNDFKGANLPDVMKLLSGAMFKNTIEVRGNLKVGKFHFKKKIPIKISEKVKLN